MEENRADLPENSTAETESQPITKAISFTPTETNETAATTAPTEKKPAWKKVLGAIGDIVLVCVIIFWINAYYTDQMREQFDNVARYDANETISELKDMGVSCTVEVTDEKLPKAEKYSWKEIREGGGRPSMLFQMLMYNESFPDIFKTGKSVKYLSCTRNVKVYIVPDGAEESQYVGDVNVSIQAFYQGYGKKGWLYFDDAEPDARLESFISSYADKREQELFKQSFVLRGSNVDYYNETITISYDWTNPWDEDVSPMWAFSLSAYQNGQELRQDYYNSETDPTSSLAPGSTGSYAIVYYLRDTTAPVKLVVANSYSHFSEDDPPTIEFDISMPEANTTSQSGGYQRPGASLQGYSDIYDLYEQFQDDIANGNYTEGAQGDFYDWEEVRDYWNYDDGEDLAELTLHDFGGYGEVSFYALGQDILTYDVTFEGAYAFSGYTVDCFQFDDYESIQDLLVFRSGSQEWLVTWNDHHKDGAVYTYEP